MLSSHGTRLHVDLLSVCLARPVSPVHLRVPEDDLGRDFELRARVRAEYRRALREHSRRPENQNEWVRRTHGSVACMCIAYLLIAERGRQGPAQGGELLGPRPGRIRPHRASCNSVLPLHPHSQSSSSSTSVCTPRPESSSRGVRGPHVTHQLCEQHRTPAHKSHQDAVAEQICSYVTMPGQRVLHGHSCTSPLATRLAPLVSVQISAIQGGCHHELMSTLSGSARSR